MINGTVSRSTGGGGGGKLDSRKEDCNGQGGTASGLTASGLTASGSTGGMEEKYKCGEGEMTGIGQGGECRSINIGEGYYKEGETAPSG